MQWISFHRTDQGQGHTGATRGVFDDRTTCCEAPVRLCRFDHGQCHPVLHAGGVLAFQFSRMREPFFGTVFRNANKEVLPMQLTRGPFGRRLALGRGESGLCFEGLLTDSRLAPWHQVAIEFPATAGTCGLPVAAISRPESQRVIKLC